jgi:hypothetical protein
VDIVDTSKQAVNINETTTELVGETEPAENAENTEKFGSTIMVSEISIFTLAVENLQFNFNQCNKINSSEKGLTQHMWMKKYPSNYFRHYYFDYCNQDDKKKNTGTTRKSVMKVT